MNLFTGFSDLFTVTGPRSTERERLSWTLVFKGAATTDRLCVWDKLPLGRILHGVSPDHMVKVLVFLYILCLKNIRKKPSHTFFVTEAASVFSGVRFSLGRMSSSRPNPEAAGVSRVGGGYPEESCDQGGVEGSKRSGAKSARHDSPGSHSPSGPFLERQISRSRRRGCVT